MKPFAVYCFERDVIEITHSLIELKIGVYYPMYNMVRGKIFRVLVLGEL